MEQCGHSAALGGVRERSLQRAGGGRVGRVAVGRRLDLPERPRQLARDDAPAAPLATRRATRRASVFGADARAAEEIEARATHRRVRRNPYPC
jgi:hypothetical protein